MTDSFYVVPTLGAGFSTTAIGPTAAQIIALKQAQAKQKAKKTQQAAKALSGTGSEGYYLGATDLSGLGAGVQFGILAAVIGIMWLSGRNL